jgi:hypothetical protein
MIQPKQATEATLTEDAYSPQFAPEDRESPFLILLDRVTNFQAIAAVVLALLLFLMLGWGMRDNNAQLRERVESITGEAVP